MRPGTKPSLDRAAWRSARRDHEGDILDYNKACGETDPLMIDPVFARSIPHGRTPSTSCLRDDEAFYSLGEKGSAPGYGTRRTQSQQRIEISEPFR